MKTPASLRTGRPRRGAQPWRAGVELLSSMRFAIALLAVICIASVIGTVVHQHEPLVNYVNQFGPFWAELFLTLRLNTVYSAWWFLLILAFLVISTTLCILRNTPKYLADMRNFKENIRHQSLQAFGHKASASLPQPPAAEAQRMGRMLADSGWKVRLQERDTPAGKGWMVAAKAGAANKIGYIAAHSAIVLICLGGLLDGDLFVRAITWLGGKSVYTGSGLVANVGEQHRLPASNPAFRGNLMVAEGTQSGTAILSQSDGVLLQELPFALELKKFQIEFYPTGMPKLFASDVVIHDRATGEKLERRIEVNHPATYRGVSIYQSGFDDGGSRVTLRAVPIDGSQRSFDIQGRIGSESHIDIGSSKFTLELTDLRVINVENMGEANQPGHGTDVRRVDLGQALSQRLGAADKGINQRELRNVGPSITYKLRDEAGQAREFHNYMLPIDMGSGPVYLLGVRNSAAEPFSYIRLPIDDKGGLDGFVRLRTALLNPVLRARAVQRYAQKAAAGNRPEMVTQLAESAARALGLFAGVEKVQDKPVIGLQGISAFIEAAVPQAERERAAEVLLRILNGSLLHLNDLAREEAGLQPLPEDDATLRFMTQAVLALSDVPLYGAPLAFELQDFTQVQASVFQVTRAPGKNIVYLGCLLLILGIFAMLYVRDRRLWIWLAPSDDNATAGSQALIAMSANRKTLDADREFAQLRQKLMPETPAKEPTT